MCQVGLIGGSYLILRRIRGLSLSERMQASISDVSQWKGEKQWKGESGNELGT